jgi:hypothetical protein
MFEQSPIGMTITFSSSYTIPEIDIQTRKKNKELNKL